MKQLEMKTKSFTLVALTSLFLTTISCTKEGPAGANGKDGINTSIQKGNIVGTVKVYDQYGDIDLVNNKDITLNLNGVSPGLTTMTDNKGAFKFSDVPSGTLSIELTPKVGYTSYRFFDSGLPITFAYTGGPLDFNLGNGYGFIPSVLELSKTSISATQNLDSYNTQFNFSFSPEIPEGRSVRILAFLSNKNTVSNTEYLEFREVYLQGGYTTGGLYINRETFPFGSDIYVKFYTANPYEYISEDSKTGYATINKNGASNVIRITDNNYY